MEADVTGYMDTSPPDSTKPRPVGLGLQHCPVYHPTEEEFLNPLEYIGRIRQEAEQYGICKICPPKSWNPPFMVDKDNFSFDTRIQSVDELQNKISSTPEYKEWNSKWLEFLKAVGKERKRNPTFCGREIDLFKFYRLVEKRGGYAACCDRKLWREVAKLLGVVNGGSNLTYGIRTLYAKTFERFDKWLSGDMTALSGPDAEDSKPKEAVSGPAPDVEQAQAEEAAAILESLITMTAPAVQQPPAQPTTKAINSKKRKTSEKRDAGKKKKSNSKSKKVLALAGVDGTRIPANIDTLLCEICAAGHCEDKIILCDRCDKGFHLFCLSPPLDDVPDGEWICPHCISRDNDNLFFKTGSQMTFKDMKEHNATFGKQWFGERFEQGQVTPEELEHTFWDIVENGREPVEVLYGADLNTGAVGSGFPRRGESDSPYTTHPWNINNFPKLDGEHSSMLKNVDEAIQGVIVPWLYIGMLFSAFCWHVEDHMFYSINYNHYGAPKQWYGVPSAAASDFETTFRACQPELCAHQPDVLFHLVTMLSPRRLRAANVPVYSCLQRAGEFVITFPNAYHGGFNHGVNAAEAVNFVPADWLRFGAASQLRYRSFRKPGVLCHEELLIDAASMSSGLTAYWLSREVARTVNEEVQLRYNLWAAGVRKFSKAPTPVGFLSEPAADHPECVVCKAFLYLHAVGCSAAPGRYCCAHHAHALCDLPPSKWTLHYRFSIHELRRIEQDVRARAVEVPKPQGDLSVAKWRPPVLISKEDTPPVAIPAHLLVAPSPRESAPAATRATAVAPPLATTAMMMQPIESNTVDRADTVQSVLRRCVDQVCMDVDPSVEGDNSDQSHDTAGPAVPPMHAEGGMSDSGKDAKADEGDTPVYETRHMADPAKVRAAMARDEAEWAERSQAVWLHGGVRPAEVDELLDRMQQFQWGEADPEVLSAAHNSLQSAKDWYSDVQILLKNPVGLETAGPYVENTTLPIASQPVARLCEQVRKTRAWVTEVEALKAASEGGLLDLDAAEEMLLRTEKLPMSCKLAVSLKEAVDAAREVRKVIRQSVLPYAPSGNEPAGPTSQTAAPAQTLGSAAPGDASAAPTAAVDAQGDVCMAPGAEESSMNGNAANGMATAGVMATKEEIPNGHSHENDTLQPMDEDTPLEGRAKLESTPGPTLNGATKGADTKPSAVKLSVAPPALPVAPLAETGLKVKKEEVATGARLMEDEFRALQQQARNLQVTFPELAVLERAAKALDAWKERVREHSEARMTMDGLEKLLADAATLAVTAAELPTVSTTVTTAQKWIAQAEAAMAARKPLKEMRKLLHTGERLAVATDCAADLKLNIRRREWEERASKALSSKGSLANAQALVAEAEPLGMDAEGKATVALSAAIAAATAWDEGTAALLARCEAAAAAAVAPPAIGDVPTPPSLDELTACIADMSILRLRTERQTALLTLQASAQRWQQSATEALAACNGESASTTPNACAVGKLIAEGQALGLSFPELKDLNAHLSDANSLSEAAKALLKEPKNASQMPALQELHDKASQQPIAIEELEAIDLRLSALKWEARATNEFASCLSGDAAQQTQTPAAQQAENGTEPAATESGAAPMGGADKVTLEAVCAMVEEANNLDVDEGLRVKLRDAALAAFAWQTTAAMLLNVKPLEVPPGLWTASDDLEALSSQHEPPALNVDDDGRVMLESAQQLVALAAHLAVIPPLMGSAAAAVAAQQAFEEKSAQICADAVAWEAMHAAQAAQPSSEASGKVPEGTRLSLHEIAAHIAAADSSRFSCTRITQLRGLLTSPADALGELRRILTKKGSAATQKVDRAVAAVAQSAASMRAACELVMPSSRSTAAAGTEGDAAAASGAAGAAAAPAGDDAMDCDGPATAGRAQGDTGLYCLCQQEYEEGQQMVCCDHCSGWYHLRCCNLTAAAARNAETWACPICTSVTEAPVADHIESHLARIHRTRCPTVQELQEVLTRLEACAAVVPEEATLRSAITDMNAWERCISAQLEIPAGHATAVPESAWIEVARQAAAVEIDAADMRTRILVRIAVERWSTATTQLLAQEGGAPLSDVDAALVAARSIEGAAKSAAYKRATEAVAALRDVRRRSSEVLGAIDHAHERSVTQINADVAAAAALRQDAQKLLVRDEALVAQLGDASVTYCLCRLPNKVDGAMLTCSRCSGLYHLACLGIPREKEPKELICPICAGKAGHRYAWADYLPGASVAALERDHPTLATVAMPEAPRGAVVSADHPPKPTDIPQLQDHVTMPRGYIEYLENLALHSGSAPSLAPSAAAAAPATNAAPAVAAPATNTSAAAAAAPVLEPVSGPPHVATAAAAEPAPAAQAQRPAVQTLPQQPCSAISGPAPVTTDQDMAPPSLLPATRQGATHAGV